MHAVTAEKLANSAPEGGPKLRLLGLHNLDGRTVAARRAASLTAAFTQELGGELSVSQAAAVERAAMLVTIAQDARARRLASDESISLEDLVRVDAAADRAVRRLGFKAAQPKRQNLREYLAARQASSPATADGS
jgi:hypothetical protein